jgi:hypothetical protein
MGEVDRDIAKGFSIADLFQYQLTGFIIVYTLSILIVKVINRTRYSWIVGVRSYQRTPFAKEAQIPAAEHSLALKTEAA